MSADMLAEVFLLTLLKCLLNNESSLPFQSLG